MAAALSAAVTAAATATAEGWISLFDGRSLAGWKASESPASFENFEVWPAQGFEIQVNNCQKQHGDYLELKKTGSLYGIPNVYKAKGVVSPSPEAGRCPGARLTLVGLRTRARRTLPGRAAGLRGVASSSLPLDRPLAAAAADGMAYGLIGRRS